MRRRKEPTFAEQLTGVSAGVTVIIAVGLWLLLGPGPSPSSPEWAVLAPLLAITRTVSQFVFVLALLSVPLLLMGWRRVLREKRRALQTFDTRAELGTLTPEQFEKWCAARILEAGYRVEHVGGQGDHGIDLVAKRGDEVVVVQCKRNAGRRTVGEPQLRDVFGAMHAHGAQRAIVISAGWFSAPAREWAQGKPIELWDVERLVGLGAAGHATPMATSPDAGLKCARCGAGLVRRRNRRDGSAFLGCSRFPTCRYTAPHSVTSS